MVREEEEIGSGKLKRWEEVGGGGSRREEKGRGRRGVSQRCLSFQRTPEHRLLYIQMRGSQGRQCMVASSVSGLDPPLEQRLMNE